MFLGEGQFTRTGRRYTVQGRNGWYQIDEYTNRGMERNVDGFKTRKQAEMTAGHLNQAYYEGQRDALIGLVLPLVRGCEHTDYTHPDRTKTMIPAGTPVGVIGKNGAAWLVCKVMATGLEFECQYADLRPQPIETA